MVAAAMILGGGGSVAPLAEMLLELALAALMVPLCFAHAPRLPRPSPWVLALAGLTLLIPVAQLVPLPPALWHALPGRATERASLDLVGAGSAWMPLSMAPARTWASLLAMACPALVMIQTSRLDRAGRTRLCLVVALVAGLSIVLGALQIAHFGGLTWSFYEEVNEGWLIGFHSNRNAETDTLQIAMMALAAFGMVRIGQDKPQRMKLAAIGAGLGLGAIGVVLCGSRAGLSEFPLTLGFCVAILWSRLVAARLMPRKRRGRLALGALVIAIGFALLRVARLPAVERVLERFNTVTDQQRIDLWKDTLFAARQVWPFGGGVGTFGPLMQAAERLEVVDASFPVRAHNEWLEWLLEAGLPGLVVLALGALVLGTLLVRALREGLSRGADPLRRAHVLFAAGTLIHLGLHATVDYPMRSIALACLAAVAVAMLTRPPEPVATPVAPA